MINDVAMIVIACMAAMTDVRTRKIPNMLIATSFIVATVVISIQGGIHATLDGLTAMVLTIAVLLIPFALGILGGGDVKLLGVLALWSGKEGMAYIFFGTSFVGAIMALWMILRHNNPKVVLRHLFNQCMAIFLGRKLLEVSEPYIISHIPYAVPILFGVLIEVMVK